MSLRANLLAEFSVVISLPCGLLIHNVEKSFAKMDLAASWLLS